MASSLASTLGLIAVPSSAGSLDQRITLLDNTIPAPSDENLPPAASGASTASGSGQAGRRETLRKAIAQRKYRRWGPGPGPFPSADNSEENLPAAIGESPDPRAAGTVERVGEDVEIPIGATTNAEGRAELGGRERTDTGGNANRNGSEGANERRTGRKKKGQSEKEIAEIDILYENQRGMFICGIPLFSSKGLLNFDPPAWQSRHFAPSLVDILTAQLPDPSWAWAWRSWYVDMTSDVDEEGWTYSFSFSPAFSWHGTHIWFHSFVRRRRWLRKRVKVPHDNSREPSPHGLNSDYFTIHTAGRLLGGPGWTWQDVDGDGREDSALPPDRIPDVPALMRALRTCRLDREKVAAVKAFLDDGGDEVVYLPERVPEVMDLMIFQASRRELLALLLARARPEAVAVAEQEVRRREYWSGEGHEGHEGHGDVKGKGKGKGKARVSEVEIDAGDRDV